MRVAKIFIMLLTFLALISCAALNESVEDTSSSQPQQPVANLTFDDLPVPAEMILDRKSSFVYETSNYRTGMLFYKGNLNVIEVANFYKSKMGEYEWKLVNSLEYKDGCQLIFEKPEWIVVIRIKAKGENSSQLEITIGPKGT